MGVIPLGALYLEFSAVRDYFRCDLCVDIDFAEPDEMSVHKAVKTKVSRYNAKYYASRWVGSII